MEDYEGLVDEATDESEQAQDIQDGQLSQYEFGTFPQAKEQSNLYHWFWKIVGLDLVFRMVKVANLNNTEIGASNLSVRDSMNLAHLGEIFHHKKFAEYFETRAKIVSATSMSRNGWLVEKSISQKRVRERERQTSPQQQQEKWKIFNRKANQPE